MARVDTASRAIGDCALHPALKDSMLPLWQCGELAFVLFAGSSDLSRSHFETQDSLEAGLALASAGVAPAEAKRCAWPRLAEPAGQRAGCARRALNQGRDWPVLNDRLARPGGLFKRLYGLSDAALGEVFPGAVPRDIGLV